VQLLRGEEELEGSVLGIGEAQALQTLVHRDLEPVLHTTRLDQDVPSVGERSEVVTIVHREG
jgi:hypothetical protein